MKQMIKLGMRLHCVAALLLACGAPASALAGGDHTQIRTLNGGDRCIAGRQVAITWQAGEDLGGNVDLMVWDGANNVWHTIAAGIPADVGAFVWLIPETLNGDRFRLKIVSRESPGVYAMGETFFAIQEPAGRASGVNETAVAGVTLANDARPNPMAVETAIRYTLASAENVTLGIYDAAGNLVRALVENARRPDGANAEIWDGTAAGGAPVASGVYFYRLTAGKMSAGGEIVVVR